MGLREDLEAPGWKPSGTQSTEDDNYDRIFKGGPAEIGPEAEQQIIQLRGKGWTPEAIAAEIGINARTIYKLLGKFDVEPAEVQDNRDILGKVANGWNYKTPSN